MLPRPATRIFIANEDGFYVGTDLMEEIADNISESELTIKAIYEYTDK